MPQNLPKIIVSATRKVPEHMKAAIANSLFPALGSLMHNVTFRYPDNVLHEPHFMCGIIGPQSVGKGKIDPVIRVITRSLQEHDALSQAKLKEWSRQVKSTASNKAQPARPEDAAILIPPPDTTNPAFVQLLMDAEQEGNRFLYTNMPEVDMLNQFSGGHRKVTQVIRLAYDLSRYGQMRVTANGVSGTPVLRWNFNFSCVEQKAQSFFKDSLLDGTLSRIGISYVQRQKNRTGEIPKQGIYDDAFARQLEPFLIRLQAATGEICCLQANSLIQSLSGEMADIACLSDDDNFEALSYRALVIAWLKACVLYVANAYKWTDTIAAFCRWSLYYDLWSKLALFAPSLRDIRSTVDTAKTCEIGPVNLLDMLPEEFSYQTLVELRTRQGKPETGTRNLLRQWKFRGYITATGDDTYRKVTDDTRS